MTPLGDYGSEMRTRSEIDQATAEALLSGRAVGEELQPLVWVVRAYRDAALQPAPPPRGELAAWLASGGSASPTGHSLPAVDRAERRGLVTAATPKWRRARMVVVSGLATAAAKITGLSTAVKASAGLAVALASVGTAGATGALPEPAQERFDTVVESVTGQSPTEPTGEHAEFGERVSEDAKDGGVDGGQVSEDARQLRDQHRPTELPDPAAGAGGRPSELPTPGDQPGVPEELPGQRPSAAPTPPADPPSRP